MNDSGETRDFLKLHFLVFLWGFTGVLGELIQLPAIELVLFRSGIAAIALACLIGSVPKISLRSAFAILSTGALIGVHWVLFFLAVKIANVSVCMVGIATVSLWTALLEPILVPERKLQRVDLIYGVLIIGAVAIIFQSEMQYAAGFLVAIGSAIAAAIFSIFNGFFAKKHSHQVIACYEMMGACAICVVCLPVSAHWLSEGKGLDLIPSVIDWFWLFVLALVCTVYAFTEYVELLKRMSVFTVNFANNLEPVYGILLGGALFGDYRHLGLGFYTGSIMIAVLVLAHTRMTRRKTLPVG